MAADLLVTEPGRRAADRWRSATRRVFRRLYLDLGRGPAATSLLAGSGRSGTTWIAEVLNHANASRYMFEPFHPDEEGTGRWFPPRTYARPGADDPRIAGPVRLVLEGRVRDPWTDQYNRKAVARRRLLKEVWANLLLGWIHRAFPDVPIVLLLRHPCAVVDSQLHTGWNWHADPASFLDQPDLMEDHLARVAGLLRRATDPFDRHLVVWCVENAIPLRQFAPGQIHVAFFEHLWTAPERELPPLFAFLGRPWDPGALTDVRRPSALARREGTVGSDRSPLESWRENVSSDQLNRAIDILGEFGLDRIYGADPFPLVATGADALLGRSGP